MKKLHFVLLSILLVLNCSPKSREQKVRELVEPLIIANLPTPESYEFIDVQIDSCFTDSKLTAETLEVERAFHKLYNEYKQTQKDIEYAQSKVEIYEGYNGPSKYYKEKYKKTKAELEKAQYKSSKAKKAILQLYIDNRKLIESTNNHEFLGYMALYRYRQDFSFDSDVIKKIVNEQILFLNQDLTEITNSISKFEMSKFEEFFEEFDIEDFNSEFGEELNHIHETWLAEEGN